MGDTKVSKEQNEREKNAAYFWKRHTALLDLVDLVSEPRLRKKLKTKILDVAHEVNEEMLDNKEEENADV